MRLVDYFDRTCVINLPERSDRRRMVVRELERVDFIRSHKLEIVAGVRVDTAGGFPSATVRGCVLAHLNVLKRAQTDRLRNVLVIEDDLVFVPQFRLLEPIVVEQLQRTDWDFAFFGHYEPIESSGCPTLLPYAGAVRCTHFYGVSTSMLGRLISYCESLQADTVGPAITGRIDIDGIYSDFRARHRDVRALIAVPSLGWQRSSRSDAHPKWFDRVPLLRQAAHAARAVRTRLTVPIPR